MAETTDPVLSAVAAERNRQDLIWGQQDHAPERWLSLLGVQYGRIAAMVVDHVFAQPGALTEVREELIQAAAVAVAAVESLDRNELKDSQPQMSLAPHEEGESHG